MTAPKSAALLVAILFAPLAAQEGKEKENKPPELMSGETFRGIALRNVGPALTSGRVIGFAVHPENRSIYYVASASGGVWKTENAGVTWTPVFDSEGSYSIGTVVIDPRNPSVVWVGTGEANNQRSVSWGDGIYKSEDNGKSWKNVGLKNSEHIARILIDPRDSNVVYVAAQGPLWSAGGDRGLYKTTDGGKTWAQVLKISDNTGVTDVVMDPQNPDVLLAAAHQRRRHVWTLIHGGPESALYKSTDAGKTWTKVTSGLPSVELGRIGLAVTPAVPNLVYATVEAADGKSGVFRSNDFGQTWEKRGGYIAQAMYYAQLIIDPKNPERIYMPDVYFKVSDDGGKSFHNLGEKYKHVDNHAIWVDPKDPSYYLVGCDGGIYESFDRGVNWQFKSNLPVTQFYDVAVDDSEPFYNIYGGTQDNFSLGGPARTKSDHGITNQDWFVTQGGDGFQSRIDPKDPNTVYAEAQYGALVRYDRRTGEAVGIQPQQGKGEPPLRWNWDSPLLISPHSHTRIYFAANKLYRSDDRGDSWKAVSGDLTRQVDRNQLPVMGKIWGPDAVAKSSSTSLYSNCTALNESAKKEGLLYVGTDDGLINVTENGGGTWRRSETFPGVPAHTYVARLLASQHDINTVYAAFDNHKNGDFAPYLLKSTDAGKTWTSVKGNLPEKGPVLALAEDHKDPNMLFAGTEYGLLFSIDGGQKWMKLSGGMPTIAVRDLAVQKRENDLVAATFGRGFFVLDDYSALRGISSATLDKEAALFSVRDALLYVPTRQYGLRGKSFQGESFYTASNPPFGAVFTYYLKDGLKSRKEQRQQAEKDAAKKNEPLRYPSLDELRSEDREESPAILLTITDGAGKVVRTVTGETSKGFHRIAWDLRSPAALLGKPRGAEEEEDLFSDEPGGPFVTPGTYNVALYKRVEGKTATLAGPVRFEVRGDPSGGTTPADRVTLSEFQLKALKLQRAVSAALDTANQAKGRIDALKRALDSAPAATDRMKADARTLEAQLQSIFLVMRGDDAARKRNEASSVSIAERVEGIAGDQRQSSSRPTRTADEQYEIASELFSVELARLRTLVQTDLPALEKAAEAAGAPPTPGHLPELPK
jgi:photosystem II stability/assembly factor-like uncharacterized protein